jgi:hypothetical protein
VDRFAYLILVRRGGCGVLTRHPSVVVDEDVVASAEPPGGDSPSYFDLKKSFG